MYTYLYEEGFNLLFSIPHTCLEFLFLDRVFLSSLNEKVGAQVSDMMQVYKYRSNKGQYETEI